MSAFGIRAKFPCLKIRSSKMDRHAVRHKVHGRPRAMLGPPHAGNGSAERLMLCCDNLCFAWPASWRHWFLALTAAVINVARRLPRLLTMIWVPLASRLLRKSAKGLAACQSTASRR